MWSSYGTGRYVASEADVLMLPRHYKRDGTARGVIYCHGASALALTAIAKTPWGNLGELLRAVVDAGFPMVSCDLGAGAGTTSTDSWGNTNAQTRVGQAKTWLQSASGGGAKSGTVLLMGASMGNAVMVNYAKNNPSNVGAMVGLLPVSDLQDIRVNDRGGLRASIDSAWGVVYPTALPAGANPATDNAGAVGVPYRTFYASDDTVVTSASATALTTAIGGTATNLGALGHTDAAVGAVNPSQLIEFFASYT